MDEHELARGEALALAAAALELAGTTRATARCVAEALVDAELAGHRGHGLSRVPSYAAQVRTGKVDGRARAQLEVVAPAVVRVDARDGFAYPAMGLAIDAVTDRAEDLGVAMAALHRSHHIGAAGLQVERLADQGLVGLLFANSPAAIAPWGGTRPVFGTNPIAFAAPRAAQPPLVVDLSISVAARGRVMLAEREGRRIPSDWALDAAGNPTEDPVEAMAGSMQPIGGAKGAALAMMVEVLAAAVTGAALGSEASSFFQADGSPPGVGQLLLALRPGPPSGGAFAERLEALCAAVLEQDGCRLPGTRRWRRPGATIAVPATLHAELEALVAG